MSKIAIIGECMLRLEEDEKNTYKQVFSSDSYNCSINLKKILKNSDIEYITVLGSDDLSKSLLDSFKHKNIETSYIDIVENKNLNLLMHNQNNNTSYWLDKTSPKKLFLTKSYERISNDLMNFDFIYFSSSSLAFMNEEGRNNFFKIIKRARFAGVKIVYESNYLNILYKSIDKARDINNTAINYCDIFISTLEDEYNLWGEKNSSIIVKKLKKASCEEIILISDQEEIIYSSNNVIEKIEKLENKIEIDSFIGLYLASRIQGKSIKNSILNTQVLAS